EPVSATPATPASTAVPQCSPVPEQGPAPACGMAMCALTLPLSVGRLHARRGSPRQSLSVARGVVSLGRPCPAAPTRATRRRRPAVRHVQGIPNALAASCAAARPAFRTEQRRWLYQRDAIEPPRGGWRSVARSAGYLERARACQGPYDRRRPGPGRR